MARAETAEARKKRARSVLTRLRKQYGEVETALDHRDAFELLAATILSAQCTDARVNAVTPALFDRYPGPRELAAAQPEELEGLIRSTGFFRQKAKSLIAMSQGLVEKHGAEVPQDMEALVALRGVARKTANVVLGSAFGIPSGVVVDTHVKRLAGLLGFTTEKDPVKIERDLCALIAKRGWIDFGHLLIYHGREICVARRPRCTQCTLNRLCPSAQ